LLFGSDNYTQTLTYGDGTKIMSIGPYTYDPPKIAITIVADDGFGLGITMIRDCKGTIEGNTM
jgi:hypothetical protein